MPGAPERATKGHDRILAAAYDLFTRQGIRAVGIDAIIARADVAKATLYRNFESKDELALAVLERREELWTNAWLQAEVERRADTPAAQLLAVFDVLGEWFVTDDFEGCTFINVMLEVTDPAAPVRRDSVERLANIRAFLSELVAATGVSDVDGVTRQWHILMKGSIVSAAEGDEQAGRRAQELARLLLEQHGVEF